MSILEIIVALIVVCATVLIAATAVLLWRAPDALTRVNVLGPTVSLALPMLLIAKLAYDWGTTGFSVGDLVRALLAIFGLWVIGATGSFYIARAIHGVTVEDREAR